VWIKPNWNRFTEHKTLAAGVVLMVLLGVYGLWLASASTRGRLAARIDVRCGEYEVLGMGLPPAWVGEYAACLRERYGIKYRPVAGCIVSPSLESYVRAYDTVVSDAVARKFGKNVFLDCQRAAENNWEQRAEQKREHAVSMR